MTGKSEAHRRLGAALRGLMHWTTAMSTQAAKQLNLHPTDFACIGYLATAGEALSPKQIIAHLGVTSSTGTALLDRLEQAGHIHRVPNPDDRRSVLIELDRVAAAEAIELYLSVQEAALRAVNRRTEADLTMIAEFLEELCGVPSEAGRG